MLGDFTTTIFISDTFLLCLASVSLYDKKAEVQLRGIAAFDNKESAFFYRDQGAILFDLIGNGKLVGAAKCRVL